MTTAGHWLTTTHLTATSWPFVRPADLTHTVHSPAVLYRKAVITKAGPGGRACTRRVGTLARSVEVSPATVTICNQRQTSFTVHWRRIDTQYRQPTVSNILKLTWVGLCGRALKSSATGNRRLDVQDAELMNDVRHPFDDVDIRWDMRDIRRRAYVRWCCWSECYCRNTLPNTCDYYYSHY